MSGICRVIERMGGLTLGENQSLLINSTRKNKDNGDREMDDLYK